jgi:hypothetical protein
MLQGFGFAGTLKRTFSGFDDEAADAVEEFLSVFAHSL